MTADESTITGYLESPDRWHPRSSSLAVAGWVFSAGSPVCGVEVVIDRGAAVPLTQGLRREDVARRFGVATSETSGFMGVVPLGIAERRQTLHLECFVLLEDGARIRWLQRRVRFYDGGLVARLERVGGALGDALRAGLRERRLPPAPRTWPATLLRHWRGIPVAPRRLVAPAAFDRARFDESFRRAQANALEGAIAVRAPAIDPPQVVTLPRDPQELAHLSNERGLWLPPGDGEFVVLLDSITVPTSDGLARVGQAIVDSGADWVYTDDCRTADDGRMYDAYLKGAFSREQALFDDYATRLAIGRRSAIARVGGLNGRFGQAAIHDLVLRLAAADARIHHLPHVCAFRIRGVPSTLSTNHLRAAEQALNGWQARGVRVAVQPAVPPLGAELPSVLWPADMLEAMPITIVIPTRDGVGLLRRCIDSLRRTVNLRRTRLLIVDDRSRDRRTLDYLEHLAGAFDPVCAVTRPPNPDGRFNYARLMNHAAGLVETPLMLHLNNDVEAMEPGWLDQMAGWMSRRGVGIVGAQLRFQDGSLQHGGVAVPSSQGLPEHLFHRLRGADPGYQWLPHRVRNVSAVTGACLLTRTALFRDLGGFDAEHLPVQFNDIDYCLRASARGWRTVYEPGAALYHDESASRGRSFDYRENACFARRHEAYREPFVSPHFDSDSWCGSTPVVVSPKRWA